MNKKIFSLYDRVAQQHLPLWLAENDETAKRAIRNNIEQDKDFASKHHDYDLASLGTLDTQTGTIVPQKQHVCTVTSLNPANPVRPFETSQTIDEMRKEVQAGSVQPKNFIQNFLKGNK